MDFDVQDLRQTEEWAKYLKKIGWVIERVPDFLYIKKIPLLPWSIGKLQRAKRVDWKVIKKIRKKHRVIYLQTKESVCNKTIWIDITKSQKKLLSAMKSKTRYNIGLAKRKGIRVKVIEGRQLARSGSDRGDFFDLLRQNGRRLKIFTIPHKWYEAQVTAFGKKCFVVLAYKDKKLIAGIFFMTSQNTCFYSHNGSTELGRRLMAPTLCVWRGILEAKKRKLKVFDFDGIYDGSRGLKRWKGFSRFKKGFGGKEIIF